MKTAQKRIYKIYTPLSVSVTPDYKGTLASQAFKTDESGDTGFNPNRRITPTVILPVVRTYDVDGVFRTGIVNDLLADMHWYDGDVEIVSGTDYQIDTSNGMTRGQLTVYRNTPAGSGQLLRFEAVITDTRRNENVKVILNGVSLTTVVSSGDQYELILNISSSGYYNPLDNLSSIQVIASAFRGDKGQAAIEYELRKAISSGGSATDRAILSTDYEIISIAAGTFNFDIRMINEESYVVIGKVNSVEVARKNFTIKRKYPKWQAEQSGTDEMIPGQAEIAHRVEVSASNGIVNDPIRFFSIQPHTVTIKKGDMNWGERQELRINPYVAGFQDGSYLGVYFEVEEIPALNIATDETGNNNYTDELGNRFLI